MIDNKEFRAVSPTGEEYIGQDILDFSIEHKLDSYQIARCLTGQKESHRGFVFEYISSTNMGTFS